MLAVRCFFFILFSKSWLKNGFMYLQKCQWSVWNCRPGQFICQPGTSKVKSVFASSMALKIQASDSYSILMRNDFVTVATVFVEWPYESLFWLYISRSEHFDEERLAQQRFCKWDPAVFVSHKIARDNEVLWQYLCCNIVFTVTF